MAPWLDLSEDLLDRIFAHLPSFADRACCFGVCSQWRSTALQLEDVAPLMPWLLRPSTAGASYYRIFNGTTTDEPAVPENSRGARFLGSGRRCWFVVARGQWRGYALLNLTTGNEVLLPDGLLGDEIPVELEVGVPSSALIILAATVSRPLTPDGRYIVAGITFGHHKAVWCCPGMDRWMPMEPPFVDVISHSWEMIMLEDIEDVIYYKCDQHEGFYFLTSQEHLLVLDTEFDDDGDGPVYSDLTLYTFPGHRMTSPPEAGQNVAGRYLVKSGRRLLMVKRFISPGHGTVSFQVFRLRWRISEPYWHRKSNLVGKLLFIGRGCSRAFQTGGLKPGYIYFLDDTEGFRDSWCVVRTEKQYRCSDSGRCYYFTQRVEKCWPEGPPPDCSPWIWLFH